MRHDRGVTTPPQPLVDLAHAYGVSTTFVDWQGHVAEVSAETITAVLAAMGVDATDPAAALEAH